MRIIYTLLFVLFIGITAMAQTNKSITGTVKDESGKGLAAATVSLLNAKDSALVKAALTDKEGAYEFINIKEGEYVLNITSVGFVNSFSKVFVVVTSKETNLPAITLTPNVNNLAGVTVQAKRPFIETKIDKTVVNVEASPTNAGATALEVLEKSPGVTVSSDGNISLRGKQGVIVMIDGKPTYLSATDLSNLLKNMPASTLDQIEIMTNPSSKYDASGNSGIINIKTKKGKAAGFNGSVMVGVSSAIFENGGNTYLLPRSQNSVNFNYRKNKFNFFGNYNPNVIRGRSTQNIHRNFYDAASKELESYTDQVIDFKFRSFNQTLKLGLDWYADKKNTFGIVVSGFDFDGHPAPKTTTQVRDAKGQLTSSMLSKTDNDVSFQNFTGNINWRHQFDSAGKELTADVDYVKYNRANSMLLETIPFTAAGTPTTPFYLRGDLPSNISIFSVKSDFVRPFKSGKLEAGIKSSYVKNDNLVVYNKKVEDRWYHDNRSNHFIYEENINAAYVNINRQFKKWTLQGGLRVENTNATGDQQTTRESFKRDTTNLFPTAFISYAADKKNQLTVSYSKRITRPNYQNLNPFIFFADSLTYQKGNPNLTPQYTHNIEVSHAFKGKYITTLAFNNTSDVIAQVIKPEGIKMFNSYDNVAQLNNISLSLTIPVTVTKWWNANVFSTVFNNHFKGIYNTAPLDIATTSFMINMTNSFTISKGFTAELSGFYRHRGVDDLALLEAFYQMNIGVQKQIMNGKGTVRLNIRDPFAWQQFKGTIKYEGIDMNFHSRPDIRQVAATFTYRFGKSNQQTAPRRRTAGSQEEQNRVGQGG